MTLSSYVYERRHAFAKAAGVTGGVYLAGSFVLQRLGDMRGNLVEERVAREK
jgi:peroxin-3